MNKAGKSTAGVRAIAVVAAICALVIAVGLGGCSKGSSTAAVSKDPKGMLDAVGKWYVAQGQLDMTGFKAGIYDPDNVLGVATATAAPKGIAKENTTYTWVGNSIVIVMPSQHATVTATPSKTQANKVDLADSTGRGGSFIMKNVDGVWKIDVNETQKIAASAAGSSATSSAPSSAP